MGTDKTRRAMCIALLVLKKYFFSVWVKFSIVGAQATTCRLILAPQSRSPAAVPRQNSRRRPRLAPCARVKSLAAQLRSGKRGEWLGWYLLFAKYPNPCKNIHLKTRTSAELMVIGAGDSRHLALLEKDEPGAGTAESCPTCAPGAASLGEWHQCATRAWLWQGTRALCDEARREQHPGALLPGPWPCWSYRGVRNEHRPCYDAYEQRRAHRHWCLPLKTKQMQVALNRFPLGKRSCIIQ